MSLQWQPLRGRTAVITGAGSGIGRATANVFAARGAAVACLDHNSSKLDRTVQEIQHNGGKATGVVVDLAQESEIVAAVAACKVWTGNIDSLVHVAGIGLYAHSRDVTIQQWDQVMAVNARAPFLLTRALMPDLIKSGGTVGAVGSVAGTQGWAYCAAYAASKGALIAVMRSLAVEYGPSGVRINIVNPGSVRTDMGTGPASLDGIDTSILKRRTGLTGRQAEAHEIANALAFLASVEASFISGAIIPVDGGAFA